MSGMTFKEFKIQMLDKLSDAIGIAPNVSCADGRITFEVGNCVYRIANRRDGLKKTHEWIAKQPDNYPVTSAPKGNYSNLYSTIRPRPIKNQAHDLEFTFDIPWDILDDDYIIIPIPRTPRRATIQREIIDGECSYVGTGSWMILRDALRRLPKVNPLWLGISAKTVNKLMTDRVKVTPEHKRLFEVGRVRTTFRIGYDYAVFYDGEKVHVYDSKIIDYLYSNIEGFALMLDPVVGGTKKDDIHLAVVMSGETPVGILAPLRLNDDPIFQNAIVHPINRKTKSNEETV